MATSGSTTVNATWTTSGNVGDALRFNWWISSQSIPNNSSVIGWSLELLSYGAGYISSSAGKSWSVTVNGSSYSGTNTIGISSNSSKTLASGTTTVGHNSDGTKSFSYSFSQQFNITFNSWVGTVSGSGSGTLTTIPRYVEGVSFKNTTLSQTGAAFQWSAGQACSHITVYVNNSSRYSQDINASSGTVSLGDLDPGTQYSVKLNLTRKDSGLSKDCTTLTVTTQPLASLSSSNVLRFNIGEDLTLSFDNPANNASTLLLSAENDSGAWVSITEATQTVEKGKTSYLWKLSSFSSQLYTKCITKNSMNIKISVGTTLNNKRYENVYNGTAQVTGSNPVFSSYTAGNSVKGITDLLGSSLSLPRGYGNMQITIPAASKAAAKNAAVITHYNVQVLLDEKKVHSTVLEYKTTDITYDIGTFDTVGSYRIEVYAADSRGNASPVAAKTFSVLPYHIPIPYITLYRHNNFEEEILISSYYMYAKLLVGSAIKNPLLEVRYRYAEAGSSAWSAWKSLTLTNASATDSNEQKKTFDKTSSADCLLKLAKEKSYNFEFELVDSLQKALGRQAVTSIALPQGIPILMEADNGFIGINRIPDWNPGSSGGTTPRYEQAKLQIASDILLRDTDGNDRQILDTIKHFILSSAEEPVGQIAGGIWNKTS